MFRFLMLSGLLFLPAIAAAQTVAVDLPDPGIPWPVALGSLIVALAAFLRAVIPADRFPAWLAPVFDLIGQNWGAAKNDPNAGGR